MKKEKDGLKWRKRLFSNPIDRPKYVEEGLKRHVKVVKARELNTIVLQRFSLAQQE